ncbi:T9SS type A sorting domain-containing protein [Plebeiibacterium marinum]|uniref:T9SS type A sorting domain-containing protein n=1 Tax=Plebeiibacterium marinum TaxID=2992111 RepID=A0AAE3SJX7_9BACT|nr:T9SS type A sorting domain-containing protein [Plebeiobacterium marinum]MCW3805974.1 T9SS type A sorting domain-containing protein [Plebeiobacterium marinum]
MNRSFQFLVLLFFISALGLVAQTGPGGICTSDDLVVWLKADAGVTMDGSNIVSEWVDQSANGFVASQSNAGYRPTYLADGGNGYPVIRFDKDFLFIPDNSGLDGFANGISVFVVLKSSGASEFQGVVSKSTSWNANCSYNMYIRSDGDLRMIVNNGGADAQSLGSGTIGSDTYILSGIYDPIVKQSLEIFYNSTSSDIDGGETATVGSYNSNLNIGNDTPSGNTNALKGDIAEVIIFNKGLKSAERLLLENYLSEKYGITVSSDIFGVDGGYDSSYFTDFTGIGQESDGAVSIANSAGFYISDNGNSLDNSEYITFAHSNIVNSVVTTEISGSVEARWASDWWLEKTSVNGINANITFDLPEGIEGGEYPQNISNYVLLYRASTSGNYSVVTATPSIGDADQVVFDVTDVNLQNGYYTLGTNNQTDSPVEGAPGITWYTLKTGNWDSWETWTLDPSGALPNNPDKTYPQELTDRVVIKDGKTVTMNLNNLHCASIEVEGRLDLVQTSGHTFDKISGGGRVLMASDNFPSYLDASGFMDVGQDEGTVVYYGSSFSLQNDYTFYNMEVNMTSGNILTVLGDYTLNGDLNINTGTFRINDNDEEDVITLTVNGDVAVKSGAGIRTGSGDTYTWFGGNHDRYHQIIMKGDFVNNGTAFFTNRTSADYNDDDDTGACEVIFNSDIRNQTVLCNGITRFNQLTCDKGTDKTYILDVSANAVANFNLFGRNNENVSGDNGEGGDRDGNKALRLLAGTLKLGSNIVIEELAENNTWDIDADARLWLYANASVKIDGANYLAIYGTLQCSDNATFSEVTGLGAILRNRGVLKIEGGIHSFNSIRTSSWGAGDDHLGAYVQSGGTMNVINESGQNQYAAFHLPFKTNVFQMSGGTLFINDQQNGGDADDFSMIVNSSDDNSNVTGGTVIIDAGQNVGTSNSYKLNLRAPVWNLILRNSYSTTFSIEISPYDYTGTGGDAEDMEALPLKVLNDFVIEGADYTNSLPEYSNAADVTFNTNNADVYIGRNFSIYEGATYNYGTNTTTFNGTEDGELYIGFSTPDNGYEQHFNDFVLNKSQGKALKVVGDEQKTAQYQLDNGYAPYRANLVYIDGDITIESGILDQGAHNVRLFGASNTVKKNGQCGVYEEGLTNPFALVMFKDGTINTESGAVFGNVKLNPGNGNSVAFTSDVYVKRIFFANGMLNLGSYNLKVDYLDDYNNGINNGNYDYDPYEISDGSSSEFIYTAGNVSDGGLTLLVNENRTYGFPIGVSGKYTPAEVIVSNIDDAGYITINPVDEVLKTTNDVGNVLEYYWRVRPDEFSVMPDVIYNLTYDDSDVMGGTNAEKNYYPGRVLGESPYTRLHIHDKGRVDDANNIITYDDSSGGGLPLVRANYTAGDNSRFTGDVEIFYSRDNAREARWRSNNTWTRSDRLNDLDGNGTIDEYEYHDSRQPGVNDYPKEGDVAVIGWVPWGNTTGNGGEGEPHGIWIDGTQEACAELIFTPMEDVSGNPTARVYRSNFQFRPCLCINNNSGELTCDLVSGEGMIWARIGDPDFSLMDLKEFVVQDSSYIVYENFSNDRIISNSPDISPNLMIANSGWGSSNFNVTLDKDIVTNGNFEILGNANVILDNDLDGDFTIGRNLEFFEITNPEEGSPSGGGAELVFQNNGNERSVTVGGDILLRNTNNQIYVQNANGSALDHELFVFGSINQSKAGIGLNLCDGPGNDRITLCFKGDSDESIDILAGNNPDLYRLVIDKGNDNTSALSLNCNFSIQGATSGVGVEKAIELQNGKLIVNHSGIDMDLTTGDDDFYIPSTAALEVQKGTVNALGNSGISLDGLLKVSGGIVDMASGSGDDNPIVYSASGSAAIEVSNGGQLYVGSQIRRSETSLEGVLSFTLQDELSKVEIGQDAAGIDDRGIFEILNDGSSFTHTAGTFTIVNDLRANASTPTFYFNPETSNLTSGTSINFGNGNTSFQGKVFTIYAGAELEDLNIDNTSMEGVKLTSNVVPLTVNGSLNITEGAELDANGLDLVVNGNYFNAGTYTAKYNNTYFSGSADQVVTQTGIGNFYNLYKNTSSKLVLNNNVTVDRETHLTAGTFNDGGYCFFAKGDMYIDIVTSSGTDVDGDGKGIVACGTEQQNLFGNPTMAVFKMDNQEGVQIPVGNQVTISNELIMNKGILDIDQNMLVIQKGADIIEESSFSEDNMIQTNISFTDAGIKKYFSAISSNTTFTYPIGSQGKYTPVVFSIGTLNEDASIRVKAADEHQPTVQEGLGVMGSGETDNVLQYYWILDAEGVSNIAASVVMQAQADDESTTGVYNTGQYITARLRSRNSGIWDKYGNAVSNDYNESTHELTFTLAGGNDQIDGDYTAGIDDAIPDQVAQYVSVKNGSWGDEDTWSPTIPNGPRGARVLIRHDVDMDDNYKVSYETRIDNGGKLIVGDSYGHRLGNVYGTGTLYMERGDMPAGEYDGFFAADSGRIEFGYTGVLDGSEDYDILSSIPSCNTVVVSGDGIRRLPNIELQLHGDLIIGEETETDTPVLINEHNQKLNIKKNLIFYNGTYTSKNGADCTINFNGSAQQMIGGPRGFTTGNSSTLYNLELNNSTGLLLSNDIEISNNLTFGSGVIYSSESANITITNTATNCVSGTSDLNYVSGPLIKAISAGDKFDFPVGDAGRYGNVVVDNVSVTGSWEAQYYNNNPGDDGFSPDNMVDSPESEKVAYVSHNEYWRIEAPASGNTANLTLRWDESSGVNPNNEFRVVRWTDLSPDDLWSKVNVGTVDIDLSTVDLESDLTFGYTGGNNNHYVTFGSITIPAYDWNGTTSDWFDRDNWNSGSVPTAGTIITIDNVGEAPIISKGSVAQVYDLTIASDASLTLKPGAKLTVNGSLKTNNKLFVQNTVANPSSIITYGLVEGNVTYSWTDFANLSWYHIAHPVSGVTNAQYEASFGSGNYALNRYVSGWDRVAGLSNKYADNYSFSDPLEGYSLNIRYAGQTLSYTGALNKGDSYTDDFSSGWYQVANPYPSYIDVENSGFNLSGFLNTVYIDGYNKVTHTYNRETNVGVNGGSRYIAPGQCMWLRTYSDQSVTINKSARIHASGSLKSVLVESNNIFRMEASNGISTDETVVLISDEFGSELITKYDSEKKMNGGNIINLYSIKDNNDLVINSVPEYEESVIPLGYQVSEKGMGEFTFKATNIAAFMPELDVYLVDKVNKVEVKLREEPIYTFTPDSTEANARFELRFEAAVTTDMETEETKVSQRNVVIYSTNQTATVKVTEDVLAKKNRLIEVYDVAGQLVDQIELNDKETTFDLPQAYVMYIIKVSAGGSSYQQKVVTK